MGWWENNKKKGVLQFAVDFGLCLGNFYYNFSGFKRAVIDLGCARLSFSSTNAVIIKVVSRSKFCAYGETFLFFFRKF